MTAQTTSYLRGAIVECLTTSTGKPRALAAGHLFGQGLPPGVDRTLRSIRAKDATNRKSAFAIIGDIEVPGSVADELGSDHIYECQIVISRDYFLGWEFSTSDVGATMDAVADDFMRVRKALCHPAALDTTVGGTATGIAHGGLRAAGAKAAPRVEQIGDGRDRLVNVIDRFSCVFQFSPGS